MQIIGTLSDYIEPPESDEVLLKSYCQAIHSKILLNKSIPFKIAEHHVRACKLVNV